MTRPPEHCGQPHPQPRRPLQGSQAEPRLKGPYRKEGQEQNCPSPGAGGSPRPGDNPACPETGGRGDLTCPRDLNPKAREISPVRGNFHGPSITASARRRQAFRVRAAFRAGRRGGGAESGRGRSRGGVTRAPAPRAGHGIAGHALRCPRRPDRRNIRRYLESDFRCLRCKQGGPWASARTRYLEHCSRRELARNPLSVLLLEVPGLVQDALRGHVNAADHLVSGTFSIRTPDNRRSVRFS